MTKENDGRTVTPKRVDATLCDGRVSVSRETQAASLTARPASRTPLSGDGVAVRLHLSDGDDLDVEVSLKAADVVAIRSALENIGSVDMFKGP